MKHFWPCVILLTIAQPAWAGSDDAPYYGPMKRWHGIGYKFGYEDRTEQDGSWRIDAAVHGRGDAIDLALYRAAERARAEGYRYVFFLGGRGSRSPGIDAATVYARPSREAVPPIGCRSKTVTSCYTADVGEVLRILGGPDGTQPGMPVVDHRDEFGREVFRSGYGTGGVATLVTGGVARSQVTTIVGSRSSTIRQAVPLAARLPDPASRSTMPLTALPMKLPSLERAGAPRHSAVPTPDDRFKQALMENQPVRGGDPKQGWTISD
jgi:hypothetical protein